VVADRPRMTSAMPTFRYLSDPENRQRRAESPPFRKGSGMPMPQPNAFQASDSTLRQVHPSQQRLESRMTAQVSEQEGPLDAVNPAGVSLISALQPIDG
jgi:hypothetical protein